MTTALVFAGGVAIIVGTVLGGRWLQSSAKVTGHDRVTYRVRVGPTGVAPIAAYTNWDASALLVPIHLLRYVFGREKTWSVQVTVTCAYEWGPLLDESYPDRKAAWERFDAVVAGIGVGSLRLPKPS